jgi:hypothetical protein
MLDHLSTAKGIAEAITAIMLALGAIWTWLKHVWPAVQRGRGHLRRFLASLTALPEIQSGVATLSTTVADLHQMSQDEATNAEQRGQQLTLHGAKLEGFGKALYGATTEIAAQGEKLTSLSTKVDSMANTQRAMLNTNTRMAVLDADGHGFIDGINKTWSKWTGLDERASFHLGWLNAIKPDQLARFREAWFSAVADSRRFELRVTLIHAALGKEIEVDMLGEVIPEGAVPAERYLITIQAAQVATA